MADTAFETGQFVSLLRCLAMQPVTIAARWGPFMQQRYARTAALGSHGGVQTLFRGLEESFQYR